MDIGVADPPSQPTEEGKSSAVEEVGKVSTAAAAALASAAVKAKVNESLRIASVESSLVHNNYNAGAYVVT